MSYTYSAGLHELWPTSCEVEGIVNIRTSFHHPLLESWWVIEDLPRLPSPFIILPDLSPLFYFSGMVTKELLNERGQSDYALYMVRNGVFSRYFSTLETFLPDCINRKVTLFESTANILNTLNKR